MATALPSALDVRLAALAARVRAHRVARGASWLAVAALLGALAAVALDALLTLSVAGRCLLQAAWLGAVGWLAWRWVARPCRDAVPLAEVAAHIEKQFPGLGERLLTVVGLRDAAGPEHGSPHLIHSLANETEVRTRSMDFAEAAPSRPVVWLAGAAGLALVASLAAAVAVPGAGARLRRVGLPWHRPAVVVPYRVVVSSGNPVVKRGDPVTLTAYVERTNPQADVPDAALAVFRYAHGSPERKTPMRGDGAGTFHVTRPGVAGDFEYRVQIGLARSDWHTVLAADPVELTDQTAADITPPPYAAAPKRLTAPTDLDGLQHSTALLNLKFNRTCATAFLDWRPETPGPTEVVPVSIAPDATSGTATFALKQPGVLRIVTINENGPRKLRSEAVLAVRVTPDAPPRFEQVSGVTAQPRTVRPGERVPVTLTATDDIAVATAEIEYAVGTADTSGVRIAVPLDGLGTPRAHGRFVFDLTGKGGEGDIIRFRVRVADNRHLDAPHLDPQEAVYPPTGWAELKLSASAPPLEHQEIIGQRDAFRAALSDALKDVKLAAEDADKVRTDSANRTALALHHTVLLNNARDRTRAAAAALHDAARDAALTPDLRPLAAAARDTADRTLKDAADLLRKATSDVPADRKPALSAAIKKLVEAADQIETLLGRNATFAQDRLDGRKLDALAGEQSALADKAKPDGPPTDELAKLQQELLDRLRKLVADSDTLTRAAGATTTREAQRLSADAKSVAATVRDLDRAATQLTADTRRGLLAGLSRTQAAAAERAAALLALSTTAARLSGVTTPNADDFRRVADLLARDRVIDALTELERLAQATEHVAEAFEKWAAERNDAKLAAVQLAKWQDDLRERFAAATKGTPFETLPDAAKAALRLEQQAIRGAIERLRVPAGDAVTVAKNAAAAAAGHAATMLAGDGKNAATAMTTTRETLTRLADALPTLAERLTRSRTALDQLRREQESIAAAVAEQLTRATDPPPAVLVKKFEKALEKQQKQLPLLLDLDLPGLDARQERAATALKAATADLSAGLAFDVVASQAWAKRELDRLRSALDRSPPPDERADDLARRLAAAADAVAALLEPTPRQLEPHAAVVQDAQKQLAPLVLPEAAALVHDARETVRVAESGFRDGTKSDELKRRVRAAADATAKLAARLNEVESDADRVKRLAANRRQASEDGKKLVGKTYDPAASTDTRNQLLRESEEFTHTRVGAAAQVGKKKANELALRLRTHNEPDRQVTLQKSLADALDELAAQMADISELTAGRNPTPPALPPDAADAFLPSKPLADALRAIAKEERALRDATNGVTAGVTRRTRPGDADPLAALEKRQRSLTADAVEFAKRLLAEKEVGAAEGAGKAVESARLAADRLQVGPARAAKEAAEVSAQRLKQLADTAGDRAWGKSALALAARQDAILVELNAVLDDAVAAAARQCARQQELAKKAFELGHLLEVAAKSAPPGGAGGSLAEAAELARAAEKTLADGGGEKARAAAAKMLADAAAKAAPPGDAGETTAAADAVRQAETAMQRAAGELGAKGDRAAAEAAMRQAADALTRAAKSAVSGPAPPPPDGSPNAASQSNGNNGAGASPTTAGDLSPTLPENWAANWAALPGDVKGQITQDLKARYGDDYARVIKLYFEQLAEKK